MNIPDLMIPASNSAVRKNHSQQVREALVSGFPIDEKLHHSGITEFSEAIEGYVNPLCWSAHRLNVLGNSSQDVKPRSTRTVSGALPRSLP